MDAAMTFPGCTKEDKCSEETTNLQSSPAKTRAIITMENKLLEADRETAVCAIGATPISFKLPESDGISVRRRKKPSKPVPEWVERNWFAVSRQRINGRIDKFYYHKRLDFICRSLVEVENFELYGLRPKRAKKQKDKVVEDNFPTKDHKEKVEKFLTNAYNNLMNMCKPNASYAPNESCAWKKRMKRLKSPKQGGEAPSTACQTPKSEVTKLYDELNLVDVPISYDWNLMSLNI